MAAKALKNPGMKRVEWPNSGTEQDILIREARSDPEAFTRLYRMHYELVFRYCSRRLFDRHAAEDVTSTVFFKVMNTLETFQGDADGFRKWLYRIASNAVNDHLRTAQKRAEAIRAAALNHQAADGPDRDRGELTLAVKQALLELKPKYQTVITLHFFEKVKLIDIADMLGRNPATIRSQLSRALGKLRKKLKRLPGINREV
jgi:RNA polymerase sigma-70 factor (ECF subfamily)